MSEFDDTERTDMATRAGIHGTTSGLVYRYVASRGDKGMTALELRERPTLPHHGSVSSALSSLHRKGVLKRLTERRDGYSVYVLAGSEGKRALTLPLDNVRVDREDLRTVLSDARGDDYLLAARRLTKKARLTS